MTDAHCHLAHGARRHFLCAQLGRGLVASSAAGRDAVFYGRHPWEFLEGANPAIGALGELLENDAGAGVGEIGLDRLRVREIPPAMRSAFRAQLEIAARYRRRVVLHGAKCWGEVVRECRPFAARIPAFLFHGFSRSGGLVPEIVAMNGYFSVGPAILNDHAVNYRELAKSLPSDRLLVETDFDGTSPEAPDLGAIVSRLAAIRSVGCDELIRNLERNADEFVSR